MDGNGTTTAKYQGTPTLSDVAAAAGVSTATVSRFLNTPALVQQQTRERVAAAIEDLGYAPNFGARALAAKRTNTMGAVVPTLENAIFARGLEAFQQELGRQGVTLLVASSSYRKTTEEEQIRALVSRGADGLLLIGYDRDASVYDFLDRRGVPYLIAWVHDVGSRHVSIGFDNRLSMRDLAERTLDLGHVRIGFITAERSENDRARNRWLGILDAMRARGLDDAALSVHETTYSIESGREGLRALMARRPRPTVVMCGNDVLAAGALVAAREMGISVPGDVSVTGFDDIELARIAVPPLTTVHVPHREMGRRAAQALIALRDAPGSQTSIRLETDLRIRETLGPPPEE